MREPLPREFYRRSAPELAKALMGRVLVREIDGLLLKGRIVETEAYVGVKDAASHAFEGHRSARNEAMYAQPGTAYVYFTYGMHFCMNVVCGEVDEPVAVLLRALEPIEGVEQMRAHRATFDKEHLLCSGPARLTKAMAIAKAQNMTDLCLGKEVWIEAGTPILKLSSGPRIGINCSGPVWMARKLRWWADSPSVSRASAAKPPVKLGKKPERKKSKAKRR